MTRNRAIALSLSIVVAVVALGLAILVVLDLMAGRQPEPYLWDGASPSSSP